MGWSIGYDSVWKRDIGYGVPAICDHPGCDNEIDRGISYVCGGQHGGGEHGCGLYFCYKHLFSAVCVDGKNQYHGWLEDASGYTRDQLFQGCDRCCEGKESYDPKPDHIQWTTFKMVNPTWAQWRKEEGVMLRQRVATVIRAIVSGYYVYFDSCDGISCEKSSEVVDMAGLFDMPLDDLYRNLKGEHHDH